MQTLKSRDVLEREKKKKKKEGRFTNSKAIMLVSLISKVAKGVSCYHKCKLKTKKIYLRTSTL